MVKMDKH